MTVLVILEFVGFLALTSTGEIYKPIVLIPIFFFFMGKKIVLKEKVLLPFVISIFPAAYFVFKYTHWHPIVVASHFILIAFSIFYLQKPSPRIEAFRMASLFLMGLLASSLSPELHTGLLVLSIVISLIGLFFTRSLKSHTSDHHRQVFPMPSKIWTLVVVFLLITCSVLIYPFLPRARWGVSGQSGFGFSTTGFSGDVNLNAGRRFESAGRKISLRFYLGENLKPKDIYKIFPEGLIPLRRLEVFDGQSWYSKTRPRIIEYTSDTVYANQAFHTLDVIAEPQSYSALVSSVLKNEIKNLRTDTGESLIVRKDPISENLTFRSPFKGRTHYTVAFPSLDSDNDPAKAAFSPAEINLYTKLPKDVKNSPFFKNLLSTVFLTQGKLPNDKVSSIDEFFKKEKFTWTLNAPNESNHSGISLIVDFIKNKSGHCELYATTAAILLRMQNIPTRIVTGYRIQSVEKNIFAAFDRDAHSWVEYFDGLKWNSFDPTPAIAPPLGWWEKIIHPLEDLSFTMSSFWYKEFVNVDPTQNRALIFDWRSLKGLIPGSDLKWNTDSAFSEKTEGSPKEEFSKVLNESHKRLFLVFLFVVCLGMTILFFKTNSQVSPFKNPILFFKHQLVLLMLKKENCSTLLELKIKLERGKKFKTFRFLRAYEKSRFFSEANRHWY
jgi:transglutaminase-like putative cysteine protease